MVNHTNKIFAITAMIGASLVLFWVGWQSLVYRTYIIYTLIVIGFFALMVLLTWFEHRKYL